MLTIEEKNAVATARHGRGAYFTPEPIARFMTEWALANGARRILEPSCGEAQFLRTAHRILARTDAKAELHGVELHEPSVTEAKRLVALDGAEARIQCANFFELTGNQDMDAVIGNPPYVRYQLHRGIQRQLSRQAAAASGIELNELASVWAAFVVHATSFLRHGSRMALVLPAELMFVNYAAPVRSMLLDRFATVSLVLFDQRVFADAQEEVVLLLADGYGRPGQGHFRLHQVANAAGLDSLGEGVLHTVKQPAERWTSSLASLEAQGIHATALAEARFVPLQSWGETSLGAVTGNNKWFTRTAEQLKILDLDPSEVVRISPPGSRHLRGLELSSSGWETLRSQGAATYLFRPETTASPAAEQLIAAGELAGVDQAYKCRVRSPWWRVPLPSVPDLFMTYMNADTPRLTTNSAQVHHINSIHGVYLGADVRELGRDLLPLASLNTLTMLGAEIVGRSYGGGILKLEPSEADKLPVPAPRLIAAYAKQLRQIKPEVARLLASGHKQEACDLVDGIVLGQMLELGHEAQQALRQSRTALLQRRKSRGKSVKG
ncbi:SAM-dependent methyltransferase [Glutamicibacter sp. MNS18]|uniref:SAM-dependent methyltransferase n=1 Tax=Glutamicibacter sp. MNS18 TaxID=2989817 RepID=UPI002235E36F|nr:SAM-dependent methyltransferase [Glutamicibacter sp. MNS18]MCW4466506.1 SAM-dependent methyltransferase [Glutamicibacter sp. MNS18]